MGEQTRGQQAVPGQGVGAGAQWDARVRALSTEVARADTALGRVQRVADQLRGMSPQHVPVLRALLLAEREYSDAVEAYERFRATPRPPD